MFFNTSHMSTDKEAIMSGIDTSGMDEKEKRSNI